MADNVHNRGGKNSPDRIEDHFYGTVTVGERGQIVIPAEARRAYDIETGDKLLVMGHPKFHSVMICKIDSMRDFLTQMIDDLKMVESQIASSDSLVDPSVSSISEVPSEQ